MPTPLCMSPRYAPFVLAAGRVDGPMRIALVPRRRDTADRVLPTHHYRLLWCERGAALLTVAPPVAPGRAVGERIPEGGVVLVPPGFAGELRLHALSRLRHLLFDVVTGSRRGRRGGVWQDTARSQPGAVAVWGFAPPLRMAEPLALGARRMLLHVQAVYWRSAGEQLAANARLASWLAELVIRHAPAADALPACADPQVARALALAAHGAAVGLGCATLAHEVALSPSQLRRRARAALGRPLAGVLAELRLDLAKRLLRVAGQTQQQVARQSGYHSRTAFARAFRRRFGISPGAWRRGS